MTWRSVTAGYPPDGQLVLTKVKRDRFNRFVRFLMRLDGNRWVTGYGANNARLRHSPALKFVNNTPPMPELAKQAKGVAP